MELLKNINNLTTGDIYIIEEYIIKNKDSEDLINFISNNLINISKYRRLLNTIIDNKMKINFTIDDVMVNQKIITDNYNLHKILQIIFLNPHNIKDFDLENIKDIIYLPNMSNNNSSLNEFYFTIYSSLKLNNYKDIEIIFNKSELIKLINSIFTIIYYSHYKKYIHIGYDLDNIVSLSNNILNTKSFLPFIDIYIHALKNYKIFDKLLNEDKKKTFIKKLTKFYKDKPEQNNQYNDLFNKIFNDFNI